MENFRKYKSIENHYQEKLINDTLHYYPIYHMCNYIATEKIDGANFQFMFKNVDGYISVEYGKRTSLLSNDDTFYDYQSVVNRNEYNELCDAICEYMYSKDIQSIIIYGELFGPGIQGRIYYGDKKSILFYDMVVNGKYLTPEEFYSLMGELDANDLVVPIVATFKNIDEALLYEVEGKLSLISSEGKDNNFWEGVVIKPTDVIATNSNGEQQLFYIKKKVKGFSDKVSKNKTPKEVSGALQEAQNEFELYLTDNRLKDVLGKHGMIESTAQIGEYIKYMLDDAKEDYFKDNKESFMLLDDKDKNKVFSIAGKIVSKMLFKYV